MSKHIHDECQRRQQVKLRADETLVDEFDAWVQASDHDNRADAIRSLMRDAIGQPATDGGQYLPDDDLLADAYQWMLSRSYQYDGTPCVDARNIRSDLAEALNVGRDTIKSRVWGPLERRGFIVPNAGRIVLKPRDVPPAEVVDT
jgi:hypothetical protein